MSDTNDAARDAHDRLAVEEIERSVHRLALAASCCGDAAWRGHLCPYHEGYLDGLLDA